MSFPRHLIDLQDALFKAGYNVRPVRIMMHLNQMVQDESLFEPN